MHVYWTCSVLCCPLWRCTLFSVAKKYGWEYQPAKIVYLTGGHILNYSYFCRMQLLKRELHLNLLLKFSKEINETTNTFPDCKCVLLLITNHFERWLWTLQIEKGLMKAKVSYIMCVEDHYILFCYCFDLTVCVLCSFWKLSL